MDEKRQPQETPDLFHWRDCEASDELRQRVRMDLDARRCRASNSQGPVWGDVVRRVTIDLDTGKIIADDAIAEMSIHKTHQKLPDGVKNIENKRVPGQDLNLRRMPERQTLDSSEVWRNQCQTTGCQLRPRSSVSGELMM